jgi:hypothetical protein
MELILSPKDNLNKIKLEGVKTFAVEGPTLLVVFESGETRNYPLTHLWYYSSHVDNHKTTRIMKSGFETQELLKKIEETKLKEIKEQKDLIAQQLEELKREDKNYFDIEEIEQTLKSMGIQKVEVSPNGSVYVAQGEGYGYESRTICTATAQNMAIMIGNKYPHWEAVEYGCCKHGKYAFARFNAF